MHRYKYGGLNGANIYNKFNNQKSQALKGYFDSAVRKPNQTFDFDRQKRKRKDKRD